MNPNEMLLVIPHSLLTSETIGGDIHGVSLNKLCFINTHMKEKVRRLQNNLNKNLN